MQIGRTTVLDTFAEAFDMRYTRLVVTASEDYWLDAALREVTGYSTSVIACDAETGISQSMKPESTPDGRCGAAVLMFGFSTAAITKAVVGRVGQCIMTCPTTACFNGLSNAVETIPLGKHLRFFGDGYQKSKKFAAERYWRIPVMDGEFLVEDRAGIAKGVAGGNIILQAESQTTGLAAARRAAEAIRETPGVITPFPGGVVRSGSKVGSRYKGLKASTADTYCPTLRGRVESQLVSDANCAYEIVIDGTDEPTVGQAMRIAIEAAAGEGVLAIGAGNYGGKLGKHHFHLRELLR
jgi:formylmethanofuran--tetrahydromethanopterin N-formyltransferase